MPINLLGDATSVCGAARRDRKSAYWTVAGRAALKRCERLDPSIVTHALARTLLHAGSSRRRSNAAVMPKDKRDHTRELMISITSRTFIAQALPVERIGIHRQRRCGA